MQHFNRSQSHKRGTEYVDSYLFLILHTPSVPIHFVRGGSICSSDFVCMMPRSDTDREPEKFMPLSSDNVMAWYDSIISKSSHLRLRNVRKQNKTPKRKTEIKRHEGRQAGSHTKLYCHCLLFKDFNSVAFSRHVKENETSILMC